MDSITIPTYIINTDLRKDRLQHITKQFKGRSEFEINLIEPSDNNIDRVELWKNILKAITMAKAKDEDIIIICQDDHEFTFDYHHKFLFTAIYDANRLGAGLLLGGIIGGFSNLVVLPNNLFWLDSFSGTHFMILYKPFYDIVLNEQFADHNVSSAKLSEITSNKFLIYPMISIPKVFNNSNAIEINGTEEYAIKERNKTIERLERLKRKYIDFNKEEFEK